MILRNKALLLALILCFSILLASCAGETPNGGDADSTLPAAEQQMILTLAAAMVDGVDAEDGQIRTVDEDTVEVTFVEEGHKTVRVTLNKNEDGAWVAEPEADVQYETDILF